jgi:hypothetical protein
MRMYFDKNGRYAGHSQGVTLTVVQKFIAICLTPVILAAPFLWPLLLFQHHGQPSAASYVCELAWIMLLAEGFKRLRRRNRRQRQLRLPPPPPVPAGPRDWTQDDGTRLI